MVAPAPSGCLICNCAIAYEPTTVEVICSLCGRRERSQAHCGHGHYVCDACHRGSANDLIERACGASDATNPIELATALMRSPALKMHGPEHHYLVPAVLVCTLFNALDKAQAKAPILCEARRRAEKVPGDFCGSHGDCGAAVGTGIFASLVLGASPLSTTSWRQANMLTARSLVKIATLGGPRCCKRDTFLAIQQACEFVQAHFAVRLMGRELTRCEFHERNRDCLLAECPFHPDG